MESGNIVRASAYEFVEDNQLRTYYELLMDPKDREKVKKNDLEKLTVDVFGVQNNLDLRKVKNNLGGQYDLKRDVERDKTNDQIDEEYKKFSNSEIDEETLEKNFEEIARDIRFSENQSKNMVKNIENAEYLNSPNNEAISIFNFYNDIKQNQGYIEDWEVTMLNNDLKEIYLRYDTKFQNNQG